MSDFERIDAMCYHSEMRKALQALTPNPVKKHRFTYVLSPEE